ncbi:AraC family transcriptional regulator [Winogradskya consettensis]|uniref:AraC family transcriptional regulator n=2 Tax=Winogradskya consettensis TaxID=113560 RepID=A0A919SZS4_9ACTN|nr:AraC family transcriptional regulator [Actinoplanes consettensis]
MMRNNMGEDLTVDDMARAAMFSKFHFTRVFQRVTGVSPGRFLSAMRLQQAKELLLATSMNVADISVHVGYNSVGTFSSRFTRSVGLAPTEYRRTRGISHMVQTLPSDQDICSGDGVVSGMLSMHPCAEVDLVFAGLFASRVPEGRPSRCTILNGAGHFIIDKVPDGIWYLLCQGVPRTPNDVRSISENGIPGPFVASVGPIRIRRGSAAVATVRLGPARVFDPPLLLALPDARTTALAARRRHHAGSVGYAA